MYVACLILDPRQKASGFDLTKWKRDLKKNRIKYFEILFITKYF